MYSRKLSSLVLAVFASITLSAPSLSSTDQVRRDQQSNGTSAQPWVADGGAPVPPYPQPPASDRPRSTMVADGGAPVPPYPQPPRSPKPQLTLLADGGAPVPPYPPPHSLKHLIPNLLAV